MLALKRSVTVLLVAHALLSVHAERSSTEVLQACAALKDMFNLRLIGPRFWCSHLHERQIECLESYMTPLAEHGQSGGETQYTPCEFDQATQKCSPGEPFYCATSPSPPPPARLGGGAPPAHDTHTAMDYLALSTALTLCAIGLMTFCCVIAFMLRPLVKRELVLRDTAPTDRAPSMRAGWLPRFNLCFGAWQRHTDEDLAPEMEVANDDEAPAGVGQAPADNRDTPNKAGANGVNGTNSVKKATRSTGGGIERDISRTPRRQARSAQPCAKNGKSACELSEVVVTQRSGAATARARLDGDDGDDDDDDDDDFDKLLACVRGAPLPPRATASCSNGVPAARELAQPPPHCGDTGSGLGSLRSVRGATHADAPADNHKRMNARVERHLERQDAVYANARAQAQAHALALAREDPEAQLAHTTAVSSDRAGGDEAASAASVDAEGSESARSCCEAPTCARLPSGESTHAPAAGESASPSAAGVSKPPLAAGEPAMPPAARPAEGSANRDE